jgi:hypothetical protein
VKRYLLAILILFCINDVEAQCISKCDSCVSRSLDFIERGISISHYSIDTSLKPALITLCVRNNTKKKVTVHILAQIATTGRSLSFVITAELPKNGEEYQIKYRLTRYRIYNNEYLRYLAIDHIEIQKQESGLGNIGSSQGAGSGSGYGAGSAGSGGSGSSSVQVVPVTRPLQSTKNNIASAPEIIKVDGQQQKIEQQRKVKEQQIASEVNTTEKAKAFLEEQQTERTKAFETIHQLLKTKGGGVKACSVCTGNSYLQCNTCKGIGNVTADGLSKSCNTCAATGKLNCKACKGTGIKHTPVK